MEEKTKNLLDLYLEENHIEYDETSKEFQRYYNEANKILAKTNFLIFPLEKIDTSGDNEMISDRLFKCDLLVKDKNFGTGISHHKLEINRKILQSFEALKSYLQLQVPTITINNISNKSDKDELCENIRLVLLTGYEILFWVKTSYNVQRIGFDIKDRNKFIFNDGILDISNWEFTPWEYNLLQDTSINISFPLEQMKNLTLQQSLMGILSLKDYISPNNTISSIILGYMVAGIFRNEYKDIHNEYPFLGIQSYTGMWKTSLLNLLSRVCGYNWDTILGTCDSEFAFECWMNSMWGRFYFFDEIQKASNKLLKYIQAAYNSWENRKGWAGGNWRDLGVYRKDCSLICTGEYLPQEEEALLNRFIILDAKEPFLVKKNVKAEDEFRKYEEITGQKIENEFLTTEQIRTLAIHHYRPMFLNILRNKREIDFKHFHDMATKIVERVAKEFGEMAPDTRLVNNLIASMSGYMIICGDSVDEDEVASIVTEYFVDLLDYRKDAYISWRIVNHIVDNVWEYCSWINKVKWTSLNYPMIYLKFGNEQWLVIQIRNLAKYTKNKLESNLTIKHIEQQFREIIGVPKLSSRVVKVAKWLCNMGGVFIPIDIINRVDPLKRIWDAVLDFLGEHQKELQKVKDESQNYVMDDGTFQQLINEIEDTYINAPFFDTANYSKDNKEPEKPL